MKIRLTKGFALLLAFLMTLSFCACTTEPIDTTEPTKDSTKSEITDPESDTTELEPEPEPEPDTTEPTPDMTEPEPKGITWTFDETTGTLTITGKGKMDDYTYGESFTNTSSAPWATHTEEIITITLDEGVTSIGDMAFYGCRFLKNVGLPKGIISIGSAAFSGCSSLTNINIPEGVIFIGASAFSGCSSLTSISIPESVIYLGEFAFAGSNHLRYNTYRNAKYLGNANNPYHLLVSAVSTDILECEIHPNTGAVGIHAFLDCENLKYNVYRNANYLGTPNHPYYILVSAISRNISECEIHPDTAIICDNAFHRCSRLTNITIPNGIRSINSYTFGCCGSLTSIDIPEGIIYIDTAAFFWCSSLTNVNLPKSTTSIGMMAFQRCTSLTSISIPQSVSSIGESAFAYCSSLTNVTIAEGVTSIGEVAFRGCRSLTSVNISKSVSSIGDGAFGECPSLTSVTYGSTKVDADLLFANAWLKIGTTIHCTDGDYVIGG